MFQVKGVESIEFAPVSADGSAPSTGWVKVTDIEDGSVSFNIPEATITRIQVEDKPGTWAIVAEEGDGASVTGKSLNMEPKTADLLFKGRTTSTATTRFDAPIDGSNVVNLAVRVTSRPQNGFKMVFVIINGSITARVENPLTKNGTDFLALGFTAEATSAVDATGKSVSPWYYEKVAVA